MTWSPFCLIGWHCQTYRERRPIAGVPVNHLVCQSCGYAEPVIGRTDEEYRQVAESQLPALKAKPKVMPSASERALALEQVRPFRRAK